MRRATAAVIVLSFLTSAVVTATMCGGWEFSAAARMDCCAMMGHDGEDQSAADACCARAEQAQQKFEQADSAHHVYALIAVDTPVPLLPLTWNARQAAASALQRAVQQHPHWPPLLQSSVLLI